MRTYENGFEAQDELNNPSIIEPARRSLEGYLIVPFVAALLLLVGTLLCGALQEDAPVVPQANPLKEAVPPSPEVCALPDDLCQPGAGPAVPGIPDQTKPEPYVVPPAPPTPPPSQTIPSPDVAPA